MTEFGILVGVALPFVLSPGASFTLTLAHAAEGHRATWLRVSTGTGVGIAILALGMGATGAGAAIAATPTARLALGLLGGLVLAGFGLAMIRRATGWSRTPVASQPTAAGTTTAAPGSRPLVRWSLIAVLTNPKALTLYALVVPTLAGPRLSGPGLFAGFAAVHIAMVLAWLLVVDQAVTRLPGIASNPRAQRILLGVAGTAMIGLGVVTAARALASS